MFAPVVIVESGGVPFTQVAEGVDAPPFTVVESGAFAITLVDSGASPIALFNPDGSRWESSPPEPEPVITNGGFDTDTDWTKGTGWTIAGGVAVGVPDVAVADLSQPVTLIAGQYQVDFDVVARTTGAVRVLFDGGALVLGTNRSAVGHYSETLVSAGNTSFAIRKNTLFDGSIDNVVVTLLPD